MPRPRTYDDRTGRVFPDHLITFAKLYLLTVTYLLVGTVSETELEERAVAERTAPVRTSCGPAFDFIPRHDPLAEIQSVFAPTRAGLERAPRDVALGLAWPTVLVAAVPWRGGLLVLPALPQRALSRLLRADSPVRAIAAC